MNDPIRKFQQECADEIAQQGKDDELKKLSEVWIRKSGWHKYSYHFTWMGRPIIQLPSDIIEMQELIWRVKPDVIIETGIAHGGGLIFYSSMMELLGNGGKVIGIDIDIRKHNRVEIENHPMYKNITMIEGSSIDEEIFARVKSMIKPGDVVMAALDSYHAHEHVLRELELYSTLVTKGSYLVCMDTITEIIPDAFNGPRPWGKGNNAMTALREFMSTRGGDRRFRIDTDIDDKLLVSDCPNGFLKCIA